MKKKVFIGAFCLAIAGLMAVESNHLFNDDSLESSLELANVEALSDGENENADCKFYLTRICTSGHVDHHFIELYRSNINYVKCLFNLKVAFGLKKECL